MQKTRVRVIGRPILKTPVGEAVEVSPRDARILERLGRVEIVAADDVEFEPSGKLEEAIEEGGEAEGAARREAVLATPEAPLETVAHTDPPKPRATPKKRRSGRGKAK